MDMYVFYISANKKIVKGFRWISWWTESGSSWGCYTSASTRFSDYCDTFFSADNFSPINLLIVIITLVFTWLRESSPTMQLRMN